MKKNLKLNIHEITRVEGHGNVVIDVTNGRVKEFRFEIIESPRFFEAMLRGRRFDEAQHIMSRICGICAVSHTSASLKAIESAMGIKISRQAGLLRKLAFCGEMIQSHILHLVFLVLPDMLGTTSIAPVIESRPALARAGLALKALANEICEVVAGRHIHPISLFPGGVTHVPAKEELKTLRQKLSESYEQLELILEFFSCYEWPDYSKKRDFLSLKAKSGYGAYDGEPVSSEKYPIKSDNYTKKIKEYVKPYSTAKQARSPAGTLMVGALARLNNGFSRLRPKAKRAAKKLALAPISFNPFMNNPAQLIECFHFTEEAEDIIERLLAVGPKPEPLKRPKGFGRGFGRGTGIVEAPRGTLYHEYKINRDGLITEANCIIPTAQNLRAIEEDLKDFVPLVLNRPKAEITRCVESLVRAYDPCISCSTHIMTVDFE